MTDRPNVPLSNAGERTTPPEPAGGLVCSECGKPSECSTRLWVGALCDRSPDGCPGHYIAAHGGSLAVGVVPVAEKDNAYEERNRLVALVARWAIDLMGQKAGLGRTAIAGWDEEWHGIVYIDTPVGQLSWHYHDSHAPLFEGLPAYEGEWDGHDTPEKYRRVAELALTPSTPAWSFGHKTTAEGVVSAATYPFCEAHHPEPGDSCPCCEAVHQADLYREALRALADARVLVDTYIDMMAGTLKLPAVEAKRVQREVAAVLDSAPAKAALK